MSRRTSASVLTRWLAVATAVGLLAGCGKKEEPQDTSATGTTAESPATTGTAPDTGAGAAGGDMGAGGTAGGTGATGGDMGAGGTAGGTGTDGATGGATGADMTGTTGGATGGTGAGTTGGAGDTTGGAAGAGAGAATGAGAGASAGGATQTASAGGGDGEALIKSSDCLSCHAVDTKMVGPAYAWVAHRYKGQKGAVDLLATKVKQGGAGNWNALTGGVPMPPHPQLSDADAKAMVEWILKQKPIAPPKA